MSIRCWLGLHDYGILPNAYWVGISGLVCRRCYRDKT